MSRVLALQLGVGLVLAAGLMAWRAEPADTGGLPSITKIVQQVSDAAGKLGAIARPPVTYLLAAGGGLLLVAVYGNRLGLK